MNPCSFTVVSSALELVSVIEIQSCVILVAASFVSGPIVISSSTLIGFGIIVAVGSPSVIAANSTWTSLVTRSSSVVISHDAVAGVAVLLLGWLASGIMLAVAMLTIVKPSTSSDTVDRATSSNGTVTVSNSSSWSSSLLAIPSSSTEAIGSLTSSSWLNPGTGLLVVIQATSSSLSCSGAASPSSSYSSGEIGSM